ncbi:MAG: OsmC family protein [Planctomycetota bacterium]|jgi:uncharacterized OsmC-like protein
MPSIVVTTDPENRDVLAASVGRHLIRFDVPESWGGQDLAPHPPDYFIASLGACVAAFVRRYCGRAEIDTTGMKVETTFIKEPEFLRDIAITVTLPSAGDFKGRKQALQRFAESCVLHNTIAGLAGPDGDDDMIPIEISNGSGS